MRHRYCLSLVALFFVVSSYAIPSQFEKYTSTDGLSNNYIKSICQDKYGYIWVGTRYGVNKFNGYDFQNFTNNPKDSLSISHNAIVDIVSSPDGLVWIATDLGLDFYCYDKNCFNKAKFFSKDGVLLKDLSVNDLSIYNDSVVWVSTSMGLFYREKKTASFLQVDIAELTNTNISRHFIRNNKEFWLAYQSTLFKYNAESKRISTFKNNPQNYHSFSGYSISQIFEFDHEVYIATGGGGLNKYLPEKEQFAHYKYHDGITHVVLGRDSLFYMATWEWGLVIFNPKTGQFRHVDYQPLKQDGLSSNSLTDVFFDKHDNLWIGTNGSGINKYDPHYWNFNHLSSHFSEERGLSNEIVRALYHDGKNVLWIGTEGGGLTKFNIENGEYQYLRGEYFSGEKKSNQIVLSIAQDNNDRVWVGTITGLNLVSSNTHYTSISFYKPDDLLLFKRQIWKIEKNPNGNFWLGTNQGLIDFNPYNYSYTEIIPNNEVINKALRRGITTILVDGNDLWVGTKLGLCKYRSSTQNFILFTNDPKDSATISNNSINGLLKDQWGNIWIATDFGLNKFEAATQSFLHYYESNGLADNRVISVIDDNLGNIWCSTSNGLTKINSTNDMMRSYRTSDGLLMNQYNSGAYFKDNKGWLYFGGIKGIDYFNPEAIKTNQNIPDVFITTMMIRTSSKQTGATSDIEKDLFLKQSIELKYNQNFFNINFEALNYTRSTNNQYAYMLEGLDKDWNKVKNRRTAYYNGVPPGKYRFKVIASNNDQVWSEVGDSITIVITPPIWKTWYALLVYLLIFMMLIYLANHYTIIGVKLKNDFKFNNLQREKLKEIYDAKMKFFMNISHELRTPLTLIITPLEESLKRLPEKSEVRSKLFLAHRNSNKLLNLVNQLLELRTIEVGSSKLRISKINILDLIAEIMNSFGETAANKSIQFELKTNLDLLTVWVDVDKFECIIVNLLSNAFKFTLSGGRITIYVTISRQEGVNVGQTLDNEMVKIVVEDTGKGIPVEEFNSIFERFYQIADKHESTKGTGIGLSLCKELINMHSGTIRVESEKGIGSRFILKIPLGNTHFNDNELKFSENEDKTEAVKNVNLALKNSLTTANIKFEPEAKHNPNLPNLLIVDDNYDIIQLISQSLNTKFNIRYALNGQDALKKLSSQLPDVVISDIMMPGITGLELCRKIKSEDRTKHLPVILLTAKSASIDNLEGLKSGADHYITKPFQMDLLEETINNILNGTKYLKSSIMKDLPIDLHNLDVGSPDAKFIKQLYAVVEENLSNPVLEVQFLVEKLGVSRAQLYRKIEELCGQSVKEFVRTIRLKVAAKLLERGDLRVSEIMYHVGINTRPYFIKRFKEMYKITPSEYMKRHQKIDG